MREYYKNITYFDSDYNGKSILKITASVAGGFLCGYGRLKK